MTSARKYGSISFSGILAGQEPAIKFAALSRLNEYFKQAHLHIAGNSFWKQVELFQQETDGLHVHTHEEILRADIPVEYRDDLKKIGFDLGFTRSALINDF